MHANGGCKRRVCDDMGVQLLVRCDELAVALMPKNRRRLDTGTRLVKYN